MSLTRRALLRTAGLAAAGSISSVAAQPVAAQPTTSAWPARPIRVLVGTAPGGSPDITARLLGDHLAKRLGQPVYVENMTQGAGIVAYQTAANSAPDGHTLAMLTAGFPPQAALRKNLTYDPLNGFSFVTLVCGYPMVYAVAPNSPIQSFQDLLHRAKAKPGELTYAINAFGSIYHILTKWIEIEAGVELTPIPYRGTAPAFTDVVAGRIDLMVDAATSAFPRIQSGQLRVLALSSAARYPLMPSAPVIAETLPHIEFTSWLGLAMAPATPRPIVERLNHEVRDILALPDVQQRLTEGGNVATPSTPDEMRAKVAAELARWSRVIEAGNIKME
jgi:tripartite-type tricarboxylate transporter receptor subunit TctC